MLPIAGVFFATLFVLELIRPLLLTAPTLQVHALRPKLPAIRFEDAHGRRLGLEHFTGRTVLLNVWATWCTPCRDEMPSLDALQRRFGGPAFEVVAIAMNINDVEQARRFFQRLGIRSLSIYSDRTGAVGGRLGIVGLPTTILVDAEGREIGRATGAADWDDEDAQALIARHLRPLPESP